MITENQPENLAQAEVEPAGSRCLSELGWNASGLYTALAKNGRDLLGPDHSLRS
ncbi:MAG: hypothetical protein Q7U74_01385 [Saprospiraceae bacterium]|nr:hypothetical protein [Saprospiraceae bacterium]